MIRAICDNCGKDLGLVKLELQQAWSHEIYVIKKERSFKLRLTGDKRNHLTGCSVECARKMDGDDPQKGIHLLPTEWGMVLVCPSCGFSGKNPDLCEHCNQPMPKI